MRRLVVIFIILMMTSFPIIIPLVPVDGQNFNNSENGTLTTLEYTTKYIRGEPGQKIHFKLSANGPINIYIRIPSSTYYKRNDYVESDFFVDGIILEKSGKSNYDFIWEVPENRGYVLYIYNPNYGNVSYDLEFTEPYYEYPMELIFNLILIIVFIVVITIIVLVYRHHKRKKARRNRRKKKF